MDGQRLDSIYYELEIRTAKFDEQISAAQRRLGTLTDAMPTTVTVTADVTQAQREFTRLASSAAIATSAVLAVGGAALSMADELRAAEGRLRLVTDETEDLIVAQERLAAIANDTFQGYTTTLDLYARLARATRDLGVSQQALFDVTEAVGTAVRLSAVSAQAASAALVQLGQSLASGTLRGDELNSVLEQTPRVAQAIADGLGVSVGKLRELGAAGELTSAQVFEALRSQLEALQAEAGQLEPTLSQAFQVFTNQVGRYVAGADAATGATSTLARMIVAAADHLEALATIAVTASAMFVGKALGPMIAKGTELLKLQMQQAQQSSQSAQAQVEESRRTLESARAQQTATRARVADLEATRASIIAERELAVARLQSANASAAMSQLAQLGQQQTRVQQELRAATTAAAAADVAASIAQRGHAAAIAGTTLAARAGTLAMRGLNTVMAFFGGPLGLAITAGIAGISFALNRKAKAAAEARTEVEKLREALEAMSEAEVRAELGKLEGRRIGILFDRQKAENANPTAQNAFSIEEATIRDQIARLRARFGELVQVAQVARTALETELAEGAETSYLALEHLRQGGERAKEAVLRAAASWKDAGSRHRSFAQALREGDAAAKSLLERVRARVDADFALRAGEDALRESTKATTRATEDQAKAQREALDGLASLLGKFARVDGISASAQAIATWRTEAEAARLSPYQIAEGLDRLNAALALENAGNLEALEADLAELAAQASGDALAQLDVAYAKIIKQIERKIAASKEEQRVAEALGNADAAQRALAVADGYREQLALAERERDSLKEIEQLVRRAAEARKLEAAFVKAADSNYRGQTATVADLKRAEQELLTVRTALQAQIDNPQSSAKTRAEAQQALNALVKEEANTTGEVAGKTESAASATVRVGDGIRNAAQNAMTLVQALGEGNTELARMLSGVITLGDGIAKLGEAASAAGGFSKLFSTGTKAASAAGPIAAIVAGSAAIFSAIAGTNEEAKKRAAELKAAGETFAKNLGAFVRAIAEEAIGAFASARNRLAQELGALVADAAKAAGFDDSALRGSRQSSSSIAGELARVEAEISRLQQAMREASGKEVGELGRALAANLAYAEGLQQVATEAGRAEAALQAQQREQLARAKDDLAIRRLRALGDETGARALEERRAAQAEVDQALADFSGTEGYAEYVRALREITELELQAAAATRARAAAVAQHSDEEVLFGKDLTRDVAMGARFWPEVFNSIFEDLDLGTEAGLQEARRRIREWYEAIAKDGIDEAERPIVDWMLRVFGGIGDAIDKFKDPLDRAIEAFGVQADTFGFSFAQRAQGMGVLLGAKVPGVADILGPQFQDELLTSDGRARLVDRIKQGIAGILADGQITEAERPLLEALQQLLGLMVGAIDEATDAAEAAARQAEADAAAREQQRQARLSQRARSAQARIELEDLEGADALTASFTGYSEALAAFLSQFDLGTLDGIDRATTGLQGFYEGLAALTDDEILAQWGMTREEVVDAILAVESGLDGLGQSLRQLEQQQGDFVTSIEVDFLNAIGRGLDAVILQTELWVEAMIAQAKVLGVWTEEIEQQIRTIGQSKIAAATDKTGPAATWEEQVAAATAAAVANVTAGAANGQLRPQDPLPTESPTLNARDEFVASDITRLSSTEALRMTDVLTMLHVEGRASRVALEQIVGLLSSMTGAALPALSVPRISGAAGSVVAGPTFQISGPFIGLDAEDVVESFAEKIFPHINQMLYRDALREATNAGRPGLA